MGIKLRHILFYLLLVSVAALGVSFSRFSATLTNSGAENTTPPDIEFSDWVMGHQAQGVSLENMKPGTVKTIDIWVSNWKNNGGGEKISAYDQSFNLELETTGNLPLAFNLKEVDNEGNLVGTLGFSRIDSYHYQSESRTFTAGDRQTRNFILTATWPSGAKGEQYRHEIDYLVLKIKASQSQPEQPQEEQSLLD